METKDYFAKADNQRLIVETELRLARKKACRDMQNNSLDFFNPEVETNPYIGESVEMEKAYNEERALLIAEFNRANKR